LSRASRGPVNLAARPRGDEMGLAPRRRLRYTLGPQRD
jgi:hypothetical protein